MLHEGQAFEPAMRDIEALIDSSQARVTGEVRVRLDDGWFTVTGVRSPNSLMNAAVGVYGEMPKLWAADDPKGFAAIAGIPARLHASMGGTGGSGTAGGGRA
jgi:argininosuccinate synthase